MSKPRPIEVPVKEFESNWDRIFGKNVDQIIIDEIGFEEEPRAYKTPEEVREIAEMAFDAVFRNHPKYFNHTPKGDRNGSK